MEKFQLKINGKVLKVEVDPSTPLLWVLRDHLDLLGTKYGCGIQQCGTCTVLIDGRAVRSCGVTLEEVSGKNILTIEGLSEDNSHPVQQAGIAEQVPQCGYCQSGQILTAVALLNKNTKPDEQTVNRTMNVLCRCGTYPRIRKAITKAGEIMEKQNA